MRSPPKHPAHEVLLSRLAAGVSMLAHREMAQLAGYRIEILTEVMGAIEIPPEALPAMVGRLKDLISQCPDGIIPSPAAQLLRLIHDLES